jgi:hypothetical protein
MFYVFFFLFATFPMILRQYLFKKKISLKSQMDFNASEFYLFLYVPIK